jgi:hypothetical protein
VRRLYRKILRKTAINGRFHVSRFDPIRCHESENNRGLSVFIHSFTHQWLYSPLLGPGLFFSYVNVFTQTVGLLWQVISPSQGRYLHKGQHKHRINAHTNIHALSGIRTHDPSVDSSCLRPRGHCERWSLSIMTINYRKMCIQSTPVMPSYQYTRGTGQCPTYEQYWF